MDSVLSDLPSNFKQCFLFTEIIFLELFVKKFNAFQLSFF